MPKSFLVKYLNLILFWNIKYTKSFHFYSKRNMLTNPQLKLLWQIQKAIHSLTCCSSSSDLLEEVPNSQMGYGQEPFPSVDTIASPVSWGSPAFSAIVRVQYQWNQRQSLCSPLIRSNRFYKGNQVVADRLLMCDRNCVSRKTHFCTAYLS